MMKKLLILAIVVSVLLSILQLNLAIGCEEQAPGSITVHKFHDLNSNGVQDDGEEDVEGWLFRLYNLNSGVQLVAEGNTASDGTLTFSELTPGCYKMWEELPECWGPTTPGTSWNDGYYQIMNLSAGQQATVEFGNVYNCACPPETCIDLEKTGPATAAPGETITYHFWVKNCGSIVLSGGAQVYDPLFGDDPIWDGDLQPGQVVEFDKTYTLPENCCGDFINGTQTDVDLQVAQIAQINEIFIPPQDHCDFVNTARAVGHPPGYPDVTDEDSWTVVILCGPGPSPRIDIEKYVSVDGEDWYDADTPPEALAVPVGSDVYFKFWVKNSGNVELTNITLSDSVYDVSGCTLIDPLAPGASFECVIGPLQAIEGLHVNIGTATGDYDGETHSDSDYAKYNGYVAGRPSFTFEKYVNGEDADTLAEAHEVVAGGQLTFRYEVTNTGNVPIEWTGLTDDVFANLISECGGFPRTIPVGGSDYCEISRTADDVPDGKQNIGTASVTDLDDQTDPAWYITPTEPAYTFEKYINGEDADTLGQAVEVDAGDTLTFRYEVTNTGNVPIEWTGLTDDVFDGLTSECGLPVTIPTGGNHYCEITRTAGDFPEGKQNIGTASVTDLDDQTDPAWYITPGRPAYTFEKYINGEDADTLGQAVEVNVGDTPVFSYVLVNTGNVPIEWTGLTDDVFGDLSSYVPLPQTIPPGATSILSSSAHTAGDFPEGKQNIGTVTVTGLPDQDDPAWYITPEQGPPCIGLTKTISGPYRTSDDLFLSDGIIPVAVQSENNPNAYGGENYFYFLVEITVTNLGGTELTGVVVQDTFSNEAQPFWTNDPANVTITPAPNPNNGMVHESLTWSVGTIPVGAYRTLQVKVGTESNPARLLEPTSGQQTIFYNGRDTETGSAAVTADGGLSTSIGAMAITIGPEVSCPDCLGEWYNLIRKAGPNTFPHDKCAEVTTSLPVTLSNTSGCDVTVSFVLSDLSTAPQDPGPSTPAGMTTVSLSGTATTGLGVMAAVGMLAIASVVIRRKRSLPWWRKS